MKLKINIPFLLLGIVVVILTVITLRVSLQPKTSKPLDMSGMSETSPVEDVDAKLAEIHAKLADFDGDLSMELPEQKISVRFLKGHEKVLEIGGNIGRNSCIIGTILNSTGNSNYVVLESDVNSAKLLDENRKRTHLNFQIENSALSLRPLEQKDWNTREKRTNTEDPEWKTIPTITYDELKSKYNIPFDTLVIDCEACFYTILKDMPDILTNVNLILVENDYFDVPKRTFVEMRLKQNEFKLVYTEADGFYEVWKKKT